MFSCWSGVRSKEGLWVGWGDSRKDFWKMYGHRFWEAESLLKEKIKCQMWKSYCINLEKLFLFTSWCFLKECQTDMPPIYLVKISWPTKISLPLVCRSTNWIFHTDFHEPWSTMISSAPNVRHQEFRGDAVQLEQEKSTFVSWLCTFGSFHWSFWVSVFSVEKEKIRRKHRSAKAGGVWISWVNRKARFLGSAQNY